MSQYVARRTAMTNSPLFSSIGDLNPSQISGLQSTTTNLTTSQSNHLFSNPLIIVPAPGPKKALVQTNIFTAVTVGSIPFGSESGATGVFYRSASGLNITFTANLLVTSSNLNSFVAVNSNLSYSNVENAPIVFCGTGEDLNNGGAVITSTVGAGGSGYAEGDTGALDPSDTAIYVVDTVDGGGAVTSFHFSNAGYANNIGNGKSTTVQTGTGDGTFTINVTKIAPGNGNASITVIYRVISLP